MTLHTLLAIIAALSTLPISHASPSNNSTPLFPNIAETSHASSQAATFFHAFFTAKSISDTNTLLSHYNPLRVTYYDTTLGLTIAANRSQLVSQLLSTEQRFAETAPNDRSYPLRILGDTTHGAIVLFVDTPGLFGQEIRSISSFDFVNGTVSRQVDNWDGRGNRAKASLGGDSQFPVQLGLDGVRDRAAGEMRMVVNRLGEALEEGDAEKAAAMFAYDAVFEDWTLKARVEGRIGIGDYLGRVVDAIPYGLGAEVTHVLGSARGGGYEWRPGGGNVRYGITALELDCDCSITRFTTVWDGSLLNQTAIRELAQLAPTP